MADPTATQSQRPLVELRRLTKIYQEGERQRVVLRDLSAVVQRNESVVLFGRSGSGKSTLLNLIGGIDLPSEGDVYVDGVSLASISENERTLFRRRHIGFVFQFFNLIPTLTVEENLLLPLELNHSLDREGREFAQTLLHEIGLEQRATSYPDVLSGGEQQRVAIVRALVHKPQLLLADEPTGNLDHETGHRILKLIAHMTSTAGATLVLVSHSPEALSLAQRAFRIDDGRLTAIDPTEIRPE